MIPCLTTESLKLLVGTADERYLFSPDYFRRTHFPQVLHRYYNHQLVQEVTEEELFEELVRETSPGNRLYFLFGSTGSGKSELLCWLRDRWETTGQKRPVVRISRSELNPQLLLRKCSEATGVQLDLEPDESRWDLLVKKSVTIVNQMIWTTLSDFFQTDEEIVPVALLLRPVVEQNILAFSQQVRKGKVTVPLEILSREQFDELMSSTTLHLEVEYAALRQSLLRKLDHFLFHGQDLLSMLKKLSQQLMKQRIRPLLLIDDLVQSVNIYASELLDHLITLEEGNWDVVVGLTPGVRQEARKGNDLLERILNLDTIEDRVKKLWLSDDRGNAFYTLDREQVVPYMEQYLVELKMAHGFDCTSCRHEKRCTELLINPDDRTQLLPFNAPLLKRMYDGIPAGKGKLRYLILHAKELIRFFKRGKSKEISRVHAYVQRDVFVEHEDLLLKTFAEWFASVERERVTLPAELLTHFQYPAKAMDLAWRQVMPVVQQQSTIHKEPTQEREESVSSVRDWIENRKVNPELLEPVRAGVASLVQDVVKGTSISRQFTARTVSSLNRTEVGNRVRYPIVLAPAKQKREEIVIEKTIMALEIAGYQQLKPSERTSAFARIANDWKVTEWIYQGGLFRGEWVKELENGLGMSLPDFVYQLRKWTERWETLSSRGVIDHVGSVFSKETLDRVEAMYLDWFSLRDNMIDFHKIKDLRESDEFEKYFLSLRPSDVFEKYQTGDSSFAVFLGRVQQEFHAYQGNLQPYLEQILGRQYKLRPLLEGESFADYGITGIIEREERYVEQNLYVRYQSLLERQGRVKEYREKWAARRGEVVEVLGSSGINTSALRCTASEEEWDVARLIASEIHWEYQLKILEALFQHVVKMDAQLLVATSQNDQVLYSVEPAMRHWSSLWARMEAILQAQDGDSQIYQWLMEGLRSVDYSTVTKAWIEEKRKRQTLTVLITNLSNDRNWHTPTENDWVARLLEDPALSSETKSRIIDVGERGRSALHNISYRDVLLEIENECPHLFSNLEIEVTLKNPLLR